MTNRIQILALLGWAALLIVTIYYGRPMLGENGEVAALASLITILGVSTNNLVQATGRREREKAKREFDVRKSIYMDFADGVAQKLAHLSKLLRFDIKIGRAHV